MAEVGATAAGALAAAAARPPTAAVAHQAAAGMAEIDETGKMRLRWGIFPCSMHLFSYSIAAFHCNLPRIWLILPKRVTRDSLDFL